MKEVKSYFAINNILSKIKFFTIFLMIFIFSMEILSFIFTKFNLLIINEEPSYVHKQGNKWRIENTPWGAWHKSNFKDQHSTKCFDVNYQSNNLGAVFAIIEFVSQVLISLAPKLAAIIDNKAEPVPISKTLELVSIAVFKAER